MKYHPSIQAQRTTPHVLHSLLLNSHPKTTLFRNWKRSVGKYHQGLIKRNTHIRDSGLAEWIKFSSRARRFSRHYQISLWLYFRYTMSCNTLPSYVVRAFTKEAKLWFYDGESTLGGMGHFWSISDALLDPLLWYLERAGVHFNLVFILFSLNLLRIENFHAARSKLVWLSSS